MKTALILATFFGMSAMIYDTDVQSYQKANNRLNTAIKTKTVEIDFHDDFDSTYYYHGCQAFTFKINHKCK